MFNVVLCGNVLLGGQAVVVHDSDAAICLVAAGYGSASGTCASSTSVDGEQLAQSEMGIKEFHKLVWFMPAADTAVANGIASYMEASESTLQGAGTLSELRRLNI